MYEIYIKDWEFLAAKQILKKDLNLNNINKLSKKQIKRIGRKVDPVFFSVYKKNLFFEYFESKKKYDSNLINKLNKLLKKLDITLTSYEYKYIREFIKEEFALWRTKKTIELPRELAKQFDVVPFFKEGNISIYKKTNLNIFVNFENSVEILFFPKKISFIKKNNIIKEIEIKKLKKINNKKQGVELILDETSYLLKAKNNNILWIYFNRMYSKKIRLIS